MNTAKSIHQTTEASSTEPFHHTSEVNSAKSIHQTTEANTAKSTHQTTEASPTEPFHRTTEVNSTVLGQYSSETTLDALQDLPVNDGNSSHDHQSKASSNQDRASPEKCSQAGETKKHIPHTEKMGKGP